MEPTYLNGDLLLMQWIDSLTRRPRIDEIVVIERELQPGIFYIKRVKAILGDSYWVEGDNPSEELEGRAHDSRIWGAIPRDQIKGRILFRMKRG